jgi:hypothetical protein
MSEPSRMFSSRTRLFKARGQTAPFVIPTGEPAQFAGSQWRDRSGLSLGGRSFTLSPEGLRHYFAGSQWALAPEETPLGFQSLNVQGKAANETSLTPEYVPQSKCNHGARDKDETHAQYAAK